MWMWETWASLPARLRDVRARPALRSRLDLAEPGLPGAVGTSLSRGLRLLPAFWWPCVDTGLGGLAVVRSSDSRFLWSMGCLYHRCHIAAS
ncbi:hypothetical protein BD311DRAFT_269753 [Dichomitus squalens]|uniref:Uncharacterized protein n=1 Tax=Dichomitus squalens TaxID=114155 RepID=A0A4Q9MNU1_9APHY|nr:hypothetical protein BD311DRAFT_269753 [Dichomitus squalens]